MDGGIPTSMISDMTEDLDGRLWRLQASEDPDVLIGLGCDLAGAGRAADAEWAFRRAAELSGAAVDTGNAFGIGNSLAARRRWEQAVTAYEVALAAGEPDAWRNLGLVLEDLGDHDGAIRAYRGAADSGDVHGGLRLASLLCERGRVSEAMAVAEALAAAGPETAALVACWRWCATLDPALEDDLRAGQAHHASARVDLADLLRETGRPEEARRVLERGAKLGEQVAWLPLGNLYREELLDDEAAEEAYRSGIAAGDAYCHQNLAVLLADRGDLEGAVEQFRLGAAAGDEVAAQTLRELDRG